jgi:hypothetical protein
VGPDESDADEETSYRLAKTEPFLLEEVSNGLHREGRPNPLVAGVYPVLRTRCPGV